MTYVPALTLAPLSLAEIAASSRTEVTGTTCRGIKLFVAKGWSPSATDRSIDLIEPTTEQLIGCVAHVGIHGLDRAL